MGGFDSLDTAVRVRDLIKKQANRQISVGVPKPLIGRMMSVDVPRQQGTVWFPGDDQPVSVSLFSGTMPGDWQHRDVDPSDVTESTSLEGRGSMVVCQRFNGVIYVTQVLNGGQFSFDFRTLGMSITLQEPTNTVDAVGDAASEIAGDPHETFINCHVTSSDLLINQAMEFGPFTSHNEGAPGVGFMEISVQYAGGMKYYRITTNVSDEFDNTVYVSATSNKNPGIWFRLIAEHQINDSNTPSNRTVYDFDLDFTYKNTAYGNPGDFSGWKELWFRIIKRVGPTGFDAKVTIRATNIQKGRSLGGRELFMQEKKVAPNEIWGYLGYHGSRQGLSDTTKWHRDSFSHVETGIWGRNDDYSLWTGVGGAAANYSIDGTRGIIAISTNNTNYSQQLAGPIDSFDMFFEIGVSAVATGASIQVGAIFRYVDASNYFTYVVEFRTTSDIQLVARKTVAGVTSTIGSAAVPGISYSSGTRLSLRIEIDATLDRIRSKVWLFGNDEPETWLKTDVDTDTTSGNYGLYALAATGNTNTKPVSAYFYNYNVMASPKSGYGEPPVNFEQWHTGPWRSGPIRLASDLQKTWTHDGVFTWDGTYLRWTGTIYLTGVGRNRYGLKYGKAYIPYPTWGPIWRILPGDNTDGSSPSQGFLLNAGESLWVGVPPGTGYRDLVNTYFVIDQSVEKEYALPEWAVLIAARGPAGCVPEIRLGNGTHIDKWRNLTFLNSWVNFGAPWATGQYRMCDGGIVRVKGLVKSGTATTPIANLPAGFRPLENRLFTTTVGNPGNLYARLDVEAGGNIIPQAAGNAYVSLDPISFTAEQ